MTAGTNRAGAGKAGAGGASIGATSDATAAWKTRDIIFVAIIGVAFGVVFWAWNFAWGVADPVFAFFPPAKNLIYGVWLMPAVLAPLVVRKRGAALFAEMVAAGVSMIIGSQWGPDALFSGFVQGAAAELVFAFTLYKSWSWPVLVAAAVASAAAAWVHDWVIYYAAVDVVTQLVVGAFMFISSAAIVAGGSILLARSLRKAGVLEGLPG
jgi:energy-coupling factor transport system substrate-specific component